MNERIQKIDKKSPDQEISFYYRDNVERSIDPCLIGVRGDTPGLGGYIGGSIASILDRSDDEMLAIMRQSNSSALIQTRIMQGVRKVMKEGKISKDTPWLKKLEEKMRNFELYAVSISQEMDLKQGEKDIEDFSEELRKKRSSDNR